MVKAPGVSCRLWGIGIAVGSALLVARPAQATLRFGDFQISGDIAAQNLVRTRDIDDYELVQQRNTLRVRIDYDWLKNGKFIDKFNVGFIERSKLFLLYRGVYDSIYDFTPGGRLYNQFGDPAGQLGDLDQGTRDALKFENTLREAYVDIDLKHIPLSIRAGRQQIVWGEGDFFRLLDRTNALDLTWHLQQENELGHGWDQLRIPYWMIKFLYKLPNVGPISNLFFEGYWNPGDWYPNKRRFLPDSPWSLPVADPIKASGIAPNGLAVGRLFRQGDYQRDPWENSQVGARFNGNIRSVQMSVNYFYQRWNQDDGTNSAFVKALLDRDAALAALGAGKLPAEYTVPYVHTVGISANYFEEFTEAVLKFETVYDFGVPFNDLSKPSPALGNLLTGVTKRDMWKGMLAFDRPTWARWANRNATWLILGQFFWHYLLDNERAVGDQPGFVGVAGPATAPTEPRPGQPGRIKAADQVRDWELLCTLAATSFYRHGTLVPTIAYALDPVNSYNMEVQFFIDYFVTPDFIVNVGQKYFINTTEDPVFETWGVAGANRGRSETQLRLTYQF